VKEHNIYWWAGALIGELCELRLKPQDRRSSFVSNKAAVEK
jgi:hypothetical protein